MTSLTQKNQNIETDIKQINTMLFVKVYLLHGVYSDTVLCVGCRWKLLLSMF